MDDQRQPEQIEEIVLGAELRYTRGESIARGGVTPEFAERLWRAFGYPQLPDDEVAFTDADVEALARIRELLKTDLFDEEVAIRMARAVGQTLARLAEWQTDILLDALAGSRDTGGTGNEPRDTGGTGDEAARPRGPGAPPQENRPRRADQPYESEELELVAEVAERYLGDLEPLIVYSWRRQLAAAATRAMAMAVPPNADGVPARTHLAVGFADIVQFTQLSREIDEAGLAGVVELFEATAADIIAAQGGRLVKTLGDEVMFSVDAPDRAAAIALDLAAMGDRPDLPTVRVGAAYGPVLPVMGDVYGTTVNLAARLTSFARPGAVLVDAGLAGGLEGRSGFSITRIVRRPARGLGIIQPYVLRHSGTK